MNYGGKKTQQQHLKGHSWVQISCTHHHQNMHGCWYWVPLSLSILSEKAICLLVHLFVHTYFSYADGWRSQPQLQTYRNLPKIQVSLLWLLILRFLKKSDTDNTGAMTKMSSRIQNTRCSGWNLELLDHSKLLTPISCTSNISISYYPLQIGIKLGWLTQRAALGGWAAVES